MWLLFAFVVLTYVVRVLAIIAAIVALTVATLILLSHTRLAHTIRPVFVRYEHCNECAVEWTAHHAARGRGRR